MSIINGNIQFKDIGNYFANSVQLTEDYQYSGLVAKLPCYESVGVYDVLTSHIELNNSGCKLCSSCDNSRIPATCIALEDCNSGDDCLVLLWGVIRNPNWSEFSHRANIYISSDNGEIVEDQYTISGYVNQKIGIHYGGGNISFYFDGVWWRVL